ncbi:hypothetical protein GBF38_022247 [Nibea albiflora]|uniref:Uncharacterized protein n=1 Tax=Nibea albiflora TaxID=240163 RepID=A0ACB7FL27_NIBAL|nr:hypothetical protein GBF38_022247 [Nibea albiflora]
MALSQKSYALLLVFVAAVCIQFYQAEAGVIPGRCSCRHAVMYIKGNISDFQVLEKRPACNKVELFVTWNKADNTTDKICLDTDGKLAKAFLGCWQSSLTDEAVDESVMGAEPDGSTVLPGSEPEDRTVFWISQLPDSTGEQSTKMDDVDGHDRRGSDAPGQTDPNNQDEGGLDGPEERQSDKLNRSNPCGPDVDADGAVVLPQLPTCCLHSFC